MKTLSDPDAVSVEIARPIPTDIGALNALPRRCSGLPDRRLAPDELRVYEVVGRVSLVRLQDDRDYHLNLMDLATGETIVTEVVDASCGGASNSPHRNLLAQAQQRFHELGATRLVGQVVRVQGVAFYDFDHNQTGRSRSCLELHPVLTVERVN